ncbi:hypothetical protein CYMTET_22075 [Cymbomonas tetramitiformis]|uniref:Uncharacterized protein n=1 Tax=Cymbomonas tetramitiformis TaxID=36881 RepID=A0AAE0G0Y9_9CHLO|nr:hypothetical protein CYMTET_22075 [Cymbomonas tetramitiformis]
MGALTQLLAEQFSAPRADAAKARAEKEEATAATTSTGDAELQKLKRFPLLSVRRGESFSEASGDKTHAALSKKSNSSMKYKQMVLGLALAYFHDAIVYEEATVDLLQNQPDSEYTPFLEELWNCVLRGHNTKKGVYWNLQCLLISLV